MYFRLRLWWGYVESCSVWLCGRKVKELGIVDMMVWKLFCRGNCGNSLFLLFCSSKREVLIFLVGDKREEEKFGLINCIFNVSFILGDD